MFASGFEKIQTKDFVADVCFSLLIGRLGKDKRMAKTEFFELAELVWSSEVNTFIDSFFEFCMYIHRQGVLKKVIHCDSFGLFLNPWQPRCY